MSISIIIPCHNLGNYVSESIESALCQTRRPDEIIVIDDASSDNSLNVIETYADNPLVTILHNEINLGLIETFNKGVRASSSSHFVVLSADDWMDPEFISKHLEVAREKPNCAMRYCDFVVFGSRVEEFAEKNNLPVINGECLLSFPDATPDALKNIKTKNMLHGTSLCSREWFDKVGGYRKSELPEDLDFGLRVIDAGGQVTHVPIPLLHYRQHSISQTQSQRLQGEVVEDLQQQIQRLRESEKHLNASVDERDHTIAHLEQNAAFSEQFIMLLGFDSIEHARQQDTDRPLRYKLFSSLRSITKYLLRAYDYVARRRRDHT